MLPGAAINVESASSIFENEILRGEYSYPFTIPLTNKNRLLLGFPEEISTMYETKMIPVLYERLGALTNALLYIDEVDFDYNTNIGSLNCSLVGVEGYFYALIQNKKLANLTFGGKFEIPVYPPSSTIFHSNAAYFASDVTNGVITGKPFCFPMIKWDNFGLENFDYHLCQGFINYYTKWPQQTGTSSPGYEFAYAGPTLTTDIGLARIIPMFYLKWVIQQVFTEVGFTVTSDLFSDPAFNAIYMLNNFSINIWSITSLVTFLTATTDICSEIDPSNHMPDMLVTEFLNAVCQIFNVQFIPTGLTSFDMKMKTGIVGNTNVTELDKVKISSVVTKKISDTVPAQLGINLSWQNGDSIYSNFVASQSFSFNKGNVNVFTDLNNISALNGDIYYVITEGQYYQYNYQNLQWQIYKDQVINGEVELVTDLSHVGTLYDGVIYFVRSVNELFQYTLSDTWWTRISRNFVNFKQYPNGTGLNLPGAPLVNQSIPMKVQSPTVGGWTDITVDVPHIDGPGRWFPNAYATGTIPPGGLQTVAPSTISLSNLRLMFYFGLTNNDVSLPDNVNSPYYPYAIPYSSGYNYAPNGFPNYRKIFNWNLCLYGRDGIYQTFYAAWDKALLNSTKYVLQVYLPDYDVNQLDSTSKILALNQLFLLYKKSFNIPYQETATLEVYVLKQAAPATLSPGATVYADTEYVEGGYADDNVTYNANMLPVIENGGNYAVDGYIEDTYVDVTPVRRITGTPQQITNLTKYHP